ncbi:MAG: hypothetical protein KME26_02115 [Oscillatoria princeps RMCB-10]|nr:hypothetical protein [Oscillatoria princeps RMCB-10]
MFFFGGARLPATGEPVESGDFKLVSSVKSGELAAISKCSQSAGGSPYTASLMRAKVLTANRL